MTPQRKKEVKKAIILAIKADRQKEPRKKNANSRKNIAKLQILKSLFAMSEKSSIDRLQKYIKKQIEKIEKSS
ncbi:MAG: hypothetical protein MR927_07625 [Campylobacter sp.]|uniref:hypothetical protein n=1 Tax=Campylobacter magnus TaxID=3026462 RepID=UPI00235F8107|nr:hypothetical protein [Campylobacter magnus]MCI7104038.1 hypothetical protein [Campylobacter sp.]MDD0848762.1 hypothetical protein [Campylobacter magnus]